MEEANSCPFCGGTKLYWDSVLIDEEETHFVVCNGCGCEGPNHANQVTALGLWNWRAE